MRIRLWVMAGFAAIAVAVVALADGERPWSKLFGGSAKSSTAKIDEARRQAEIRVELAWLADPVTFPYFLEAKADGTTLTVRGFVPDKTVRAQAVRLAQANSPYKVADAMKEHPSLLVRMVSTTPAQLQPAASAAIKETLPRKHSQIQVSCTADGSVTLKGSLDSAEEKLAASLALRRLQGCASVQNQIRVAGMVDTAAAKAPPAKSETKTVAKAEKPPVVASKGFVGPSLGPPKGIDEEPKKGETVKKSEPVMPPVIVPMQTTAPEKKAPDTKAPDTKPLETKPVDKKGPAKLPMGAELAKLQKRVQESCPGIKDVKLEVTPDKKLKIELTVATSSQIDPAAEKIYAVPELADFAEAVELYFTVADQMK